MKKPNPRLRQQLSARLRGLGVDLQEYGGQTLIDCLIAQEAIVITVDTPHGPEWSYGWRTSPWAPVRNWALAYFES